MVDRRKELFLNTIVIGIGSLFTKALSFLLVPLLTLWLTASEYGDYDLLFSYISLFVPVITLQLEQAVLRYSLESKENAELYFKNSFVYIVVSSFLFFVITSIFFSFEYQLSFIYCTIGYSFQIFTTEYLRGINSLKHYSLANIVSGLLTVILSYVFVHVCHMGVDGILFAFGTAYFLIGLSVLVFVQPLKQFSIRDLDKKIFKQLLQYSFPLLPNAISWWITSVSDRTLINYFWGSDFNGIYAVSTKIPTLMTVFYSVFNLSWQQSAIVSSSDSYEAKKEFYSTTFNHLFSFLFAGAYVVVASTRFIYDLFIEESYSSGMNIVPVLILSTVFLNLGQYAGGILLGNKDTKTNGLTTVNAAIINLVVNFLLIQKFGLMAAAISTLLSYIFLFLFRILKLKTYFEMKKIIVKITIFSIALLGVSLCSILIDYIIVRTSVLFITIAYFIYTNQFLYSKVIEKLKRRKS
ncbi:lipopolysaccharide biosynthesis protein [Streptococcus caprae]|uniref:Lipopolysaccharide biosynthesis protein n=1 Tax=Streptococcus caprae TaxID=1640501 RepID=A0ABV8CTI2_9STRE